MSNTLKLVISFVLVPIVALICNFVFTFGLAQIFTILRFAIPFSKNLKKENNVILSKKIYISFFCTSCLWIFLLSGISYIFWVYTNLKGGLVFGALLGLFNAIKSSTPSPDKEAQFFEAYGKYILGYSSEQKQKSSDKKISTIAFAFSVLAAVSGWACAAYWYSDTNFWYNEYGNAVIVVAESFDNIELLESEIKQLRDRVNRLNTNLESAGEILTMYDNAVAFVPVKPDGKNGDWFYHTIDCPILLGEHIISPVSDVEQLGFKPCDYCHSPRNYLPYQPT